MELWSHCEEVILMYNIDNNGNIYFGDTRTGDREANSKEISDYNANLNNKIIINSFINAVQNHLDSFAQSKGYDSILSACSYAGFQNAYQSEAQSMIAWRAACWEYLYNLQSQLVSGKALLPTINQLISGLPEYV